MKVYVTSAQFDAIQKLKLKIDKFTYSADIDQLVDLLSLCARDNGGDYDPASHRAGQSVEIIVIHPSDRG